MVGTAIVTTAMAAGQIALKTLWHAVHDPQASKYHFAQCSKKITQLQTPLLAFSLLTYGTAGGASIVLTSSLVVTGMAVLLMITTMICTRGQCSDPMQKGSLSSICRIMHKLYTKTRRFVNASSC